MTENATEKFAVLAEATGYERPLVITDLSFARLIDDVIVHMMRLRPSLSMVHR
jgi:hypothetical protein